MWCERPFPRPNSTSGGRVTPPAPGLRSRWPPGRDDTREEDAVMPAPVIIVTGVSRGIGRAIAEELQSRGAAVVGAARNVADVPTPLEAQLAEAGPTWAKIAAKHGLAEA